MHHYFLLGLFVLLSCQGPPSILNDKSTLKEIAMVLMEPSSDIPKLSEGPLLNQRIKLQKNLNQLPPFFRKNDFISDKKAVMAFDLRTSSFITGLQERRETDPKKGTLFDFGLWIYYHFDEEQNFLALNPSHQNQTREELILQEICHFSKNTGENILSTDRFNSKNQDWRDHDQFQEVYTLRFINGEGEQWYHWVGHDKGKLYYPSKLYQLNALENAQILVSSSDDLFEQFGPEELEYKTYTSIERGPANVEVITWSTKNREKNCFTPSEIIQKKLLNALIL
jgi:hypothetical protein